MRLKSDLLEVLEQWNAGKPIRSLELGHPHQMKDVPGFSPTIDDTAFIHRDQERAHAYCFHLIELFQENGVPETHDAFLEACDAYEQTFEWGEVPVSERHGVDSERDAAESLTWKALRFGWLRAIEGHKDSMYVDVTKPAEKAKRK